MGTSRNYSTIFWEMPLFPLFIKFNMVGKYFNFHKKIQMVEWTIKVG
jgi:hypothetical protein